MRKIKNISDYIFWYSLYMLPIILLVLNWCCAGQISFAGVFDIVGLNILTDNIVFTALTGVFGVGGVFPVFQNTIILEYLTYFIMLVIIHIMVDVLLFIPRFCHKLLDKGEKVSV